MAERKRILVIDDEPSIREILAIQLSRMGYEVAIAADGEEGLEAYKKEKPDLILLDLMMPRLDGLSVCASIRTLEKQSGGRVPILFLTARDTRHDKTSAALSGGDDFVAKPVSMQELRERVDAVIGKARP